MPPFRIRGVSNLLSRDGALRRLTAMPAMITRNVAFMVSPTKEERVTRKVPVIVPEFRFDHAEATRLEIARLRKDPSSSDPLRILFCGSDEFSIASLRALNKLWRRQPSLIHSIDVMIRSGKRSGRSMKTIREVPIKAVAEELGLRIHERDTFTGWEPPLVDGQPFNLIIAVSFGLFVPPRILRGAKYGGLNVHPSLLPNLKGPAPIEHTILRGLLETGVTLQTLDEEKFDHGKILAQSPNPPLTVANDVTYTHLHAALSRIGAKLLIDAIAMEYHVKSKFIDQEVVEPLGGFLHAPKITTADRKIDFDKRYRIMRQHRALGRLWTDLYIDDKATKRCVFEDFEVVNFIVPIAGDGTKRALLQVDTNVIFTREEELSPAKVKGLEVASSVIPPPGERKKRIVPLTGKEYIFNAEEALPPRGVRVLVQPNPEHGKMPLFYFENGDSIIFEYRAKGVHHEFGRSLRVKRITVEGAGSKPAAVALRRLQKGKWRFRFPSIIGKRYWWNSKLEEYVSHNDLSKYLRYPFAPWGQVTTPPEDPMPEEVDDPEPMPGSPEDLEGGEPKPEDTPAPRRLPGPEWATMKNMEKATALGRRKQLPFFEPSSDRTGVLMAEEKRKKNRVVLDGYISTYLEPLLSAPKPQERTKDDVESPDNSKSDPEFHARPEIEPMLKSYPEAPEEKLEAGSLSTFINNGDQGQNKTWAWGWVRRERGNNPKK